MAPPCSRADDAAMKKLTLKRKLLSLALAVLASAVAQPVSAQTSTGSDPVGDALYNAPAFQDIVFGQMTKTAGGDFELLMGMAGPVPVAPPLPPPGVREIWWYWIFDLDPTTYPQGYPFTTLPPHTPAPSAAGGTIPEFLVFVSWDGTEFAGFAIDRRPLLTGGEAIITPVPFSINGTMVEAVLASTLIGDVPPSFVWRLFTTDWAGPVGSDGARFVDPTAFFTFEVVP